MSDETANDEATNDSIREGRACTEVRLFSKNFPAVTYSKYNLICKFPAVPACSLAGLRNVNFGRQLFHR